MAFIENNGSESREGSKPKIEITKMKSVIQKKKVG